MKNDPSAGKTESADEPGRRKTEILELDMINDQTTKTYRHRGTARIENITIQFMVDANQQMYLDQNTHEVQYICFCGEGYAGYGGGFPISEERTSVPYNDIPKEAKQNIISEFRRCWDKQELEHMNESIDYLV